MKKIFTLTCLLAVFGFQSKAQCPANDSTVMGPGSASDVFYSLANHTVATVSNTNWHLAFSVQASRFPTHPANGVAIRVNSGLKETGGTTLVKLNGANAANWRSIDTTGLYALPQMIDSDSTWDFSAFTKGYNISSPFDFIWGTYNQTTHKVSGTNVFVLYNKTAGWYKKIFIKECDYDTMWNVIISNVDNTDSSNLVINKKSYPNKLFVYYNVLTKQLADREPVKTSWDLLWTKYVTFVTTPMGSGNYSVTGVLSNPDVTVEQNSGKKCTEVWLNNKSSKVNPSISTIGFDWKTFNGAAYDITDTFVYFIKGQNGKTYKMTFKSYSGGKSTFNIYEATTGIRETLAPGAFSVYPNPGSNLLTVESDLQVDAIEMVNMQGQVVYNSKQVGTIDISGLSTGIYIIKLHTAEGVYRQQVIKQ
jgi:hypothetical protein